MNAIIVELRGTFAAALSDDGTVTRVANKNYAIGQTIELKKRTALRRGMLSRMVAAAACLVLVCSLGGGTFAYMAPASYVSLDVNPSIEFTLNMFDRVLSAHAVNEDGAQILQAVNLKAFNNKTIDEAIRLTLDEITKEGYFTAEREGGIVIATSGKNHAKAEHLATQLGLVVKTQCAESKHVVQVEALSVDQTKMDEAKALGTTPGKLALVQELQEHYTGTQPFDTKAWLAKPVKDIMAEVQRADELDDMDDEDDAADAAKAAAEAAAEAKEKAEEQKKEADEAKKDAEDEARDTDDSDEDEDDKPAPASPVKPAKPAGANTKPKPAPTQEPAEEPEDGTDTDADIGGDTD
ncbi:MAG: hypothetical protein RRY53_04885, partial [Pseudoflavonifractor sp.]